MRQIDLAYAAGFFDGEGCTGIYRKESRPGYKSPSHILSIRIANSNQGVIEWFKEHWGGSTGVDYREASPTRKAMYYWTVSRVGAKKFMEDVGPYLKVKSAHPKLLEDFNSTFYRKWCRRSGIPPEVLAERERIYQELKRLNHKGTPKQ